MSETATKRHYDADFKRSSAELYINGNQTVETVSQHLGVPESTLYTWITEYRKRGEKSFKPKELSAHEKEVLALKKQLSDVTTERDILKKAIAIFSKKK